MKYCKFFVALIIASVVSGAVFGMHRLRENDLELMDRYFKTATEHMLKVREKGTDPRHQVVESTNLMTDKTTYKEGEQRIFDRDEYEFLAELEGYRLGMRSRRLRSHFLRLTFLVSSLVFGRLQDAELIRLQSEDRSQEIEDELKRLPGETEAPIEQADAQLRLDSFYDFEETVEIMFAMVRKYAQEAVELSKGLWYDDKNPGRNKVEFDGYIYSDLKKILGKFGGETLDWNNVVDKTTLINDLMVVERRREEISNPGVRFFVGMMSMVVMSVKEGGFNEADRLLRQFYPKRVRRVLADSLPIEGVEEVVHGAEIFRRMVRAAVLTVEIRAGLVKYDDVVVYLKTVDDYLKYFDGNLYTPDQVKRTMEVLDEHARSMRDRTIAPFCSGVLKDIVRLVITGKDKEAQKMLLLFDRGTMRVLVRPGALSRLSFPQAGPSELKKKREFLAGKFDDLEKHADEAIEKLAKKRRKKFGLGRVSRRKLNPFFVIRYFRRASWLVFKVSTEHFGDRKAKKRIKELYKEYVRKIADADSVPYLQNIRTYFKENLNELVGLVLREEFDAVSKLLLRIRQDIWGRDCFYFTGDNRSAPDIRMIEKIKAVFGDFARSIEILIARGRENRYKPFLRYFKKVDTVLRRQLERKQRWKPLDDEGIASVTDGLQERYISKMHNKKVQRFLEKNMNALVVDLLGGDAKGAGKRYAGMRARAIDAGVIDLYEKVHETFGKLVWDMLKLIENAKQE